MVLGRLAEFEKIFKRSKWPIILPTRASVAQHTSPNVPCPKVSLYSLPPLNKLRALELPLQVYSLTKLTSSPTGCVPAWYLSFTFPPFFVLILTM